MRRMAGLDPLLAGAPMAARSGQLEREGVVGTRAGVGQASQPGLQSCVLQVQCARVSVQNHARAEVVQASGQECGGDAGQHQ